MGTKHLAENRARPGTQQLFSPPPLLHGPSFTSGRPFVAEKTMSKRWRRSEIAPRTLAKGSKRARFAHQALTRSARGSAMRLCVKRMTRTPPPSATADLQPSANYCNTTAAPSPAVELLTAVLAHSSVGAAGCRRDDARRPRTIATVETLGYATVVCIAHLVDHISDRSILFAAPPKLALKLRRPE